MTREVALEVIKSHPFLFASFPDDVLEALDVLIEQEPQTFKWCTDCREYDQEKHCCHRWSKVIRDTVEEMRQEYIEREVLDKISAEIKDYFSITCDGNCDNCNRVVKNPCGESVDGTWVLHIIDKYKAEQEE